MKIVVLCQASGPRAIKPGQTMHSAQFAADQTTKAAKAANSAFVNGVPGIQLALGNLTSASTAELKAGKLYEVTFTELPDETPAE